MPFGNTLPQSIFFSNFATDHTPVVRMDLRNGHTWGKGMHEIRRLDAADAGAYREIRLEWLERSPETTDSSHVEEAGRPVARFGALITQTTVLGGFKSGALQGVITLHRPAQLKVRHRGRIGGLYVREGDCADALADALLGAAVREARGDVEVLSARVPADRDTLVELFEKHDFDRIAVVPRALKLDDGSYVDECLMQRDLS